MRINTIVKYLALIAAVLTLGPTVEEKRDEPNRLIHEKSPYLLQHAYNPVDWYPWGEAAFEKARAENKPIFLSVGYSTCHWCHVMERESFSDPEIAKIMNEHFVSIKVDREERPDVDQVYMVFVQAVTGRGGWPMSVFLSPDLKPFFGGTYFPPDRFKQTLLKIAEQWQKNRKAILTSAGKLTDQVRELVHLQGNGDFQLEKELLDRTYQWYQANYDAEEGGFEGAPKFPRPVNFNFLLRYYVRTGERKALQMSLRTLEAMARGGIHDHLGGGFHRYSTDERWFLPHFEKMAYDQAQLAVSYLEAYQLTHRELFARVARGIFQYVLRDMSGEEGAFYSAEDADSPVSRDRLEEHAEGAFYLWTQREIIDLLPSNAPIFNFYYGVRKQGNIQEHSAPEFAGKNLLHVSAGIDETAKRFEKSPEEIQRILEQGRHTLFKARASRPRPPLDDKVLTAWNGLMISALAKGYQVLDEQRYLDAAEKAAAFIDENLRNEQGYLMRRYRRGDVAKEGLLDDYAFYIQGLLDLYESSLEGRWLLLAIELTEKQNELFWDPEQGGFFMTTGEDPSILFRMREDYDGAEPSPNSIATLNLLRLSQMTGRAKWQEMARRSVVGFETRLETTPHAMPQMMVALNFYLDKPKQILIAGERDARDTRAILREIHQRFIPNKIVLLVEGGPVQKRLGENLEVVNTLRRIEGQATAYICEDYVCKLPTKDPAVVARLLEESAGGTKP